MLAGRFATTQTEGASQSDRCSNCIWHEVTQFFQKRGKEAVVCHSHIVRLFLY